MAVLIVLCIVSCLGFLGCSIGACLVFARFARAEAQANREFAKNSLQMAREQAREALEIIKASSLSEKVSTDLQREQYDVLKKQLLDSFNKEVEEIRGPKQDFDVMTTDGRSIPFSRLQPLDSNE